MPPCPELPLKQTVRKPGTRDGSLLATGTETLPPAPTPPPCHPGAITRAPPGPQSLPCRLADLGPSLLPALLSLQPAHPIPMWGLSSPPAEGGRGASMVPRSSALTSRWGGEGSTLVMEEKRVELSSPAPGTAASPSQSAPRWQRSELLLGRLATPHGGFHAAGSRRGGRSATPCSLPAWTRVVAFPTGQPVALSKALPSEPQLCHP